MTEKLHFMKCLDRKISQCILPFICFGFKKMMEKYRLTSEGNGWKNAQNVKIIINTIYMKPNFPKIKKECEKIGQYTAM